MKQTDFDDVEVADEATLAQPGIEPRGGEPRPGGGQKLGFILEEPDDEKVAKHIVELRSQHDGARSRRRAVWRRNKGWRKGERWIRLEKAENESKWRVYIPPGAKNAPPVPNKTDRLCRRVVNTILTDAPYPECEPAGDKPADKDAAEFATRYLSVRGSSAELDLNTVLRSGADKAMTYASSFAWVTMDPHAGGHRPRTMLAHPMAETAETALIDPETGEPAAEEALVERYQTMDGGLTDDPDAADLQWLPNHRIRLLTGLQVDLLPPTATHLREAVGVVIADTMSLGDLRAMFGDVLEKLTDDEFEKVCTYRIGKMDDILPPHSKDVEDQRLKDKDGKAAWKDSQVVVVHVVYYRSCSEYPLGCYAMVGGDSVVLHRETLTALMPQPEKEGGVDVPPKRECLMIPVAQCRCLADNIDDDPMGIGLSELLGPMDEIRANAFAHELEHMFRAGNPIPMLPVGSIVQPGQLRMRNGEPVYFNPQGQPLWEEVPPLPPTVPMLRTEMTQEMDDESGLQEAAQGVENPTVKSGVHAQTIVQQALKAVMELKDNVGDFYVRINQILLQQARAYLTVPQLLEYTGPDGGYKAKEFSRTDFGSTRIVTIKKGSFTMHTLAAKQEMAANMFDRKVIDPDEYRELVTSGVSPILGQQDNPSLLRVRRQLEKFRDGPTPEWQQAMQQYAMQMQQYQAVQQQMAERAQTLAALGIQSPAPQIPPPQKPPGPFDPRLPVDDEPMAAKIRHRQVKAELESSSFEAFPPEWQQTLIDTYLADRNAAGIMTVPEVQRQKAQEAAMQPPALPKGVTIGVKATEDSVDDAERNAMAGFQPPQPQSPQPGA